MKKMLAIAAAAALTCGASAFAANPFSDVTPDDWAYQAVSDLSDQGIVEGYPDGTFKGQRNMTRYELAQIIARLMAREDQMNAEQRATVDKLAGEYADELSNLGVRVDTLEKKVGNISWSGDSRVRYQTRNNTFDANGRQASDGWNGRIRLNAKAQVNDSTFAYAQFLSNYDFKNSSDSDANVMLDALLVRHQFGDFNVTLGRQHVLFGNQGGWLYGDGRAIDGATLAFASGNGKWTALAGYGRFNASDNDMGYKDVRMDQVGKDIKDIDAFYAKAAYHWNRESNLNLSYLRFAGKSNFPDYGRQDNGELFGVGTQIAFGGNNAWRVMGEYWDNTTADKYDKAWNAGLGYGRMNLKKPGTFSLDLLYNKVDRNVYFGGTTYQTDVLSTLDRHNNGTSVRYWNAIADVALMKNIYLHGEYAFDVNAKNNIHRDHDAWTVSLNFVF